MLLKQSLVIHFCSFKKYSAKQLTISPPCYIFIINKITERYLRIKVFIINEITFKQPLFKNSVLYTYSNNTNVYRFIKLLLVSLNYLPDIPTSSFVEKLDTHHIHLRKLILGMTLGYMRRWDSSFGSVKFQLPYTGWNDKIVVL